MYVLGEWSIFHGGCSSFVLPFRTKVWNSLISLHVEAFSVCSGMWPSLPPSAYNILMQPGPSARLLNSCAKLMVMCYTLGVTHFAAKFANPGICSWYMMLLEV